MNSEYIYGIYIYNNERVKLIKWNLINEGLVKL